jgi:hypothetical protein
MPYLLNTIIASGIRSPLKNSTQGIAPVPVAALVSI